MTGIRKKNEMEEKTEIQNKKRQRRGILIAKSQKTSNQLQRSGRLIAKDRIQNGRLGEVLKF